MIGFSLKDYSMFPIVERVHARSDSDLAQSSDWLTIEMAARADREFVGWIEHSGVIAVVCSGHAELDRLLYGWKEEEI